MTAAGTLPIREVRDIWGESVAFNVYGSGTQSVVIRPGNGASLSSYESLAAALTRNGSKVFVISNPDVSHVRRLSAQQAVEATSVWAADIYQKLGVGRAFHIGHSLGGGYTIALAASYPRAVKGVGLIAANGTPNHKSWFEQWYDMSNSLGSYGLSSDALRDVSSLAVRSVTQPFQLFDSGMFAMAMDTSAAENRIRSLRIPVIALRGNGDHYISAENFAGQCRRLGATAKTITGGHWLQVDNPVEVENSVVDFVNRFDLTARRSVRLPDEGLSII